MLKELYNENSIKLAGHKRSKTIFGNNIISLKAFIFPIPPDVLIIPMTIARKTGMD